MLPLPSSKRNRRRGQDDEDEPETLDIPLPSSKKNNKKQNITRENQPGRKSNKNFGKKGNSEDDEDLDPQRNSEEDNPEDDTVTDNGDNTTKKNKKKNRSNNKNNNNNNHHSDTSEEEYIGKKNSRKNKKNNRKNNEGDDDDDNDVSAHNKNNKSNNKNNSNNNNKNNNRNNRNKYDDIDEDSQDEDNSVKNTKNNMKNRGKNNKNKNIEFKNDNDDLDNNVENYRNNKKKQNKSKPKAGHEDKINKVNPKDKGDTVEEDSDNEEEDIDDGLANFAMKRNNKFGHSKFVVMESESSHDDDDDDDNDDNGDNDEHTDSEDEGNKENDPDDPAYRKKQGNNMKNDKLSHETYKNEKNRQKSKVNSQATRNEEILTESIELEEDSRNITKSKTKNKKNNKRNIEIDHPIDGTKTDDKLGNVEQNNRNTAQQENTGENEVITPKLNEERVANVESSSDVEGGNAAGTEKVEEDRTDSADDNTEKEEKVPTKEVDETNDSQIQNTEEDDKKEPEYPVELKKKIDDIKSSVKNKRDAKKQIKKLIANYEVEKENEARRQIEYEQDKEWGGANPHNFTVTQPPINLQDKSWIESRDISVSNFSINAGPKKLLDGADLIIQQGIHYGLIGPNGQGKSTLLKMIATRELHIPPNINILYVEQEVLSDDTPAYLSVLKADKKRSEYMELEKKLNELIELDNKGEKYIIPDGLLNNNETLFEKLRHVQEELNMIGIEKSEAKARKILSGLGFDGEMQNRKTKEFSGGWRMRISLARALFIEPDLLLLDEPTNHLDLNAVLWLDEYLQRYKKTLFVVSHDQDFLSSVCNYIIHLYTHKLIYYHCDYYKFKEMEVQKRKLMYSDWEKQQKALRQLKKQGKSSNQAVETVLNKPKQNNKKSSNIGMEAAEDKEMKLLERPNEYIVKFTFPTLLTELRLPILEISEVSFTYPNGLHIFDNVNFGIDLDSRFVMIGPNGCGKSTLLKLICGDLEPTMGTTHRAHGLRIGKYSQHFVDQVPLDLTPVEYIMQQFPSQTNQTARNILGRYGLEGHAHTIKLKNLSGGQKSRVVFTDISLRNPHILIFDEPTNNLDIESIDALSDAINEFEGGVVIVSHDARLINETHCQVILVGDKKIERFNGDFNKYRIDLIKKMEFDDDLIKPTIVEVVDERPEEVKMEDIKKVMNFFGKKKATPAKK